MFDDETPKDIKLVDKDNTVQNESAENTRENNIETK